MSGLLLRASRVFMWGPLATRVKNSLCFSRFKFKALELNKKILASVLNPKKPAAKEPTRTQDFELQVEQRLQQRQAARKPDEEEKLVFHPRPLRTRILREVVVSANRPSVLISHRG